MAEGEDRVVERVVTNSDLDRIYDQIGVLAGQVGNVAVAQTQTATILSGMKESLDAASRDRAQTCPTRPDMNKVLAVAYALGGKEDPVGGTTEMVNRINTMWSLGKWVGAIMSAAVLIPGFAWLGKWIVKVIAFAIAGS